MDRLPPDTLRSTMTGRSAEPARVQHWITRAGATSSNRHLARQWGPRTAMAHELERLQPTPPGPPAVSRRAHPARHEPVTRMRHGTDTRRGITHGLAGEQMNPCALVNYRWTAGVSTAVAVAILAGPAGAKAQRDGPADKRPVFEVASVKLAAPDAVRTPTLPPPASPSRLHIPSMTLTTLIYAAYGDGGLNTSMRVTGGPDWINRTAFAIEAVAIGRPTLREFRLMLQTLLEERFALKVRTEMSRWATC